MSYFYIMKIHIYNSQKDLSLTKKSVKKAVLSFFSHIPKKYEDVSVYFVSQKEICLLHEQFFNDPSPTDCISFPLDEEILGEVFICPKAALEWNPENPYEEVTLYMIHGFLHLLGFDDVDEEEEKKMRTAEEKYMRLLLNKGSVIKPRVS